MTKEEIQDTMAALKRFRTVGCVHCKRPQDQHILCGDENVVPKGCPGFIDSEHHDNQLLEEEELSGAPAEQLASVLAEVQIGDGDVLGAIARRYLALTKTEARSA